MNEKHPSPNEIFGARFNAKLTQISAASLIHCSVRTWQQWEAGDRKMHPAFWELFNIKQGIAMCKKIDFAFNPSQEVIAEFCKQSKHNAAKWIKNESGWIVYWPAEYATHTEMAASVGFEKYEKGIAVPTDKTQHESSHQD